MPTERESKLRCSFCGRTGREVWPIIEGPSEASICHLCVSLTDVIARKLKAEPANATCAFCSRSIAEAVGVSELMENTYLCLDCEGRLVKAIRGGWKP